MTGNGYTKQGTSSPAIACKTTVAKSSFSGNKTFFPSFWGTDSGYNITKVYVIAMVLYHTTFLVNTLQPNLHVYIYFKKISIFLYFMHVTLCIFVFM